jgi:hypothetical protein
MGMAVFLSLNGFLFSQVKEDKGSLNFLNKAVLFFLMVANCLQAFPQKIQKDTLAFPYSLDSTHNQMDMYDLLRGLKIIPPKKPGVSSNKNMGPFISFIPSVGYEMVSHYTAAIETNVSFYTDKEKDKISSVLSNANYSIQKQSWAIINSNLFFDHSKFNLQGDWRAYHFPTHTFGLGGETLPSGDVMIDYKYLRFYQVVLREIKKNVFLGVGYMLDYHWDIKQVNVPPALITDFERYDNGFIKTKTISSGISLNLQYDSRANCIDPKQGAYASIQYRNNLTQLNSTGNWQSLLIDLRKYFRVSEKSDNILAFWSYSNLTLNGTPPYLDLPSIGWDSYSNTGRGYIQGRYRGKSMTCIESEYRFKVTANGLLGGVVFTNVSSFSDWPSDMFKTLLPATGFGVRVKLNKKSSANFCADVALGVKGSSGIFFNMGEVF